MRAMYARKMGKTHMDTKYTAYADLVAEVTVPTDGILSRTLYNDDRIKVVLFAFDTGQELSEHTASMPATLHFLQGNALLKLGDDARDVEANAWVWMQANLSHSVYAKTPVVMLLQLIKNE